MVFLSVCFWHGISEVMWQLKLKKEKEKCAYFFILIFSLFFLASLSTDQQAFLQLNMFLNPLRMFTHCWVKSILERVIIQAVVKVFFGLTGIPAVRASYVWLSHPHRQMCDSSEGPTMFSASRLILMYACYEGCHQAVAWWAKACPQDSYLHHYAFKGLWQCASYTTSLPPPPAWACQLHQALELLIELWLPELYSG